MPALIIRENMREVVLILDRRDMSNRIIDEKRRRRPEAMA